MALNVKVGGDWKDVASGTKLRVKQNDAWKNVTKGNVKVGGDWKEFYVGSDPVKYTFLANRSKYFRHTDGYWGSSPSVVSIRTGQWNVQVVAPFAQIYNNSTYVGVFGFDSITAGGLTLAQAMAERPYVTTAAPTAGGSAENYLELTRSSTSLTGYGNAFGTWYIGKYSGDTTDTYPDADDCSFTGAITKTYTGGSTLRRGETATITPSTAEMQVFANHLKTNPLFITNKNSIAEIKNTPTSPGDQGSSGYSNGEYSVFFGKDETTPPKLVLTLDYVAP